MKKLILLLLTLFIFQCAEDKTTTSSSDTPEKTTQTAQAEQVKATKTEETTPSAPTSQTKKDGPGLNLWIANTSAKKGEDVCVKVSVSAISGLLSMQYSLRWDPKILAFKSVQGFSMPTLDANDFGKHLLKKGILTAVWIDDTLKGEHLKDGEQLYELCFTAIGEVGQVSPVRFWTAPTPYEVVVLPEKIIPLTAHKGSVTVK